MQEYKLIIAGGRDFTDYATAKKHILQIVEEAPDDLGISIVCGMARGADAMGLRFAREFDVKLYEFPADWDTYGKRAGYLRNQEMGTFADGLLAFWDGYSRGTKHMIECMEYHRKPIHLIRY